MKIDNLQTLKKLIQLCRAQGVQIMKVDGIELVLSDSMPMPLTTKTKTEVNTAIYAPGGITADTKIVTDELTPDQLLFGSSDPTVWNTPNQ